MVKINHFLVRLRTNVRSGKQFGLQICQIWTKNFVNCLLFCQIVDVACYDMCIMCFYFWIIC